MCESSNRVGEKLVGPLGRRIGCLRCHTGLVGLALLCLSCVQTLLATAATEGPRLPLALVAEPGGAVLYVAEGGSKCIRIFDTNSGKVRGAIPLPDSPAALARRPDGGEMAVVGGGGRGALWLIDPTGNGRVRATLGLGHTPTALVYAPDGKRLWVAERFADTICEVALDARVGTRGATEAGSMRRLKTGREPVALGVTQDGGTLVVAHLLPEGRADQGDIAASVALVDTATFKVRATVPLPNGSTGVRGVALSNDGKWAYVTHILARYQSPTTQLERGWMNTNALSVIDVPGGRRRATVLLDNVEQGAANPWGVACSSDGQWLAVAHSGSHEVSVVDRRALHRKLDEAGAQSDPLDDLAFLSGLQRRLRVPGMGPRGIVVESGRAFAASYYGDSIVVVPLESGVSGVAEWRLGPLLAPSAERLGEIAFHDASRCFQKWQSCASCHPDARADALNWDLMNDGLGNPKNTKSMLLSHATPPAMWLGVRKEAEVAVRSGFKHIQFALVDEDTAKAVDRYLARLAPVPSPRLIDGVLSPAARRGERHFVSLGCVACHPAPLYADGRTHDIGTTKGIDAGKPVDVPSLLEGWRTAPYLHDGSAATMRDVLIARNPEGRHGDVTTLKPAELDELIEFLLSL